MKKYLYIGFFSIVFFSAALGAMAQTSPCQIPDGPGQLGYCPLEPIKGVTLGNIGPDSLPTLLSNLFKILFSLGALMSVVMLVFGGITYMASSIPGVKMQGREHVMAALYGLLILAGSYLILYTINPNLIQLKLTLPSVMRNANPTTTNNNAGTNVTGVSGSVCNIPVTPDPPQTTSGPVQITVDGGYAAYTTASPCGALIAARLGSNAQLQNTLGSLGKSVLLFTGTRPFSNYAAILNDYNTKCRAASGVVVAGGYTSNSDRIYMCVKK